MARASFATLADTCACTLNNPCICATRPLVILANRATCCSTSSMRLPFGAKNGSAQARKEPSVETFLKVTTMWWDSSTMALVTGANKGIGYAIAEQLGELGYGVIIAARDEAKGAAAAAALRKELPSARFESVQADITDAESVARCAEEVRRRFGTITILVNNAGIMSPPGAKPNAEDAARILACNLSGTRRMTEAMLPLLSKHARIINVCSRLGRLQQLTSDELKSRFRDAASADDVQAAADEFVQSLKAGGDHAARGWPSSMYSFSKLCEIAYTFVVARQLRDRGIEVNAFCPGYCATDMCPEGTRSTREGADTALWLASLPPVGKEDRQFVTERLFADQKAIEW